MLMRGRVLLYLVFIITAAESRSNRDVIDIHIESVDDNQGGANPPVPGVATGNGDAMTTGKQGKCTVWGDPHFVMIDLHDVSGSSRKYNYQIPGTYILTQRGFGSSPVKVTSTFYQCGKINGEKVSCISDVTYYEDNHTIRLSRKTVKGHDCKSLLDPLCKIKVYVDGTKANAESGRVGHANYVLAMRTVNTPNRGPGRYPCLSIYGSKGITLELCDVAEDYGLIHIWFNPSLQYTVFGLCDTFTGVIANYYTGWDNKAMTDVDTFAKSWKTTPPLPLVDETIPPLPLVDEEEPIFPNTTPVSVDRCSNKTVLEEVELMCAASINWACDFLPVWECKVYMAACIYDLCHLSNPEGYAEAYAGHMGIRSQLSF